LLPKPDPAGILHIAKEWGLENGGKSLIMVFVLLISFQFLGLLASLGLERQLIVLR
jgi:hypothetical protein